MILISIRKISSHPRITSIQLTITNSSNHSLFLVFKEDQSTVNSNQI